MTIGKLIETIDRIRELQSKVYLGLASLYEKEELARLQAIDIQLIEYGDG